MTPPADSPSGAAPDRTAEWSELLALAQRAARAAGTELLARHGRVEGLQTKSSATDPVSDADRAAERILLEMITAARPEDAVIGEEGTDRPGTTGYTWAVDPLDGTVNYLYELADFAVSVGVEDSAGGVVGVVLDVTRDLLYSAVRGRGAFCEGAGSAARRLAVNEPVPLEHALIGTGFSYQPQRRALQGALVAALLPDIRDIRRLGSAALDLCAVAAGGLDGYFEEGIQHWDHAAGGVIVTEAGGLMTAFTPTGHHRGWLAAGPALHAALIARLTPEGRSPIE